MVKCLRVVDVKSFEALYAMAKTLTVYVFIVTQEANVVALDWPITDQFLLSS